MTQARIAFRALTLTLAPLLMIGALHAAELRITVHHVLPHQGQLRVALFDRADGFPDRPAASQPAQIAQPDGETVTLSFTDLPEGRWAVMVLQDLNGNGQIDTNLVGLPKEPYGASNNRLPRLSPPRFEEALVTVGPQGAAIDIHLRRP